MDNDKKKNEDSDLVERISATRKARIHAEERFLRYGLLAKLSLTSYALASVILGVGSCILDLVPGVPEMLDVGGMEIASPGDMAGWMSLLVAVVLLPLSVLVSAQRFSERALLMRACYVHLTQIEEDARNAENDVDKKRVFRLFCLTLALTENHHEMDYQEYRRKKREEEGKGEKIERRHRLRIYWHWMSHLLWYFPGVVLPIAVVVGFFGSVFTG